jgi:hypothetical protein
MVHFQTDLGKSCRVLQPKLWVFFKAVWSTLRTFGTFCGHLVYFMAIRKIFFPFWYIVPRKIWQPCLTSLALEKFVHRLNRTFGKSGTLAGV